MDPIKKIYRDIKKRIINALPDIANEISEKMSSKYISCVDAFYEHIPESPRYHRGFNTYLGSIISCDWGSDSQGSLRNVGGETTNFYVHVEMEVDPSYLGSPYKDPVDYVFGRTWGEGIHGNLANPQLSPSPQEKFEEWFESFKTGESKMIANRIIRNKAGIG